MRQYIRHPADIPIELSPVDDAGALPPRLFNVGGGGLAVRSALSFPPARVVTVRVPWVQPPFTATARVIWCRPCKGGYELGLAFTDADDAFRARMVEQVCHIEHYRLQQRAKGRDLTAEDAAREWIESNAARFPDAGTEP
jgi:hypothetical protein